VDTLPDRNRQIVLRRRPDGLPTPDDFELIEAPMPELAEGEALVRCDYLSIDATIRTWISAARSYFPPVQIGEVVRCGGVGEVVATRCPTLPVGQLTTTLTGWQEFGVIRDDAFATKLPPGTPLVPVLSVFGSTGMAAYFGLLDIGRPEAGQTVVVSGAAGATGSVAGQIAKILGCRVVGVAGTDEKCRWVVEQCGFDACVNYRSPDFFGDLKSATPDRIDVYFDNVGGAVLDAALARLAMHARVVLCGAISVYNDEHKPPGPANYLNLITARGRMEGFNAFDYWGRYDEAMAQLHEWVDAGALVHHAHVVEGLEQAPDALRMLFAGENFGKLIVAV
jgi:NADPH-dependent curcumin reductase CurA